MQEHNKEAYRQGAHLRYIIDHYSSENSRTIKSRKSFLFLLAVGIACALVGAWIFTDIRIVLLFVALVLVYFLAKEIGRREGYMNAYTSLLEYDEGYLARWKELEDKTHLDGEVSELEAYQNVRKSLAHLDFPAKGN